MSELRNADISLNGGRSKAFLFGLYMGLSLLLFVSYLDPEHASKLHRATNIYGLQALAGAALGFWRIWKNADNPRQPPALASVWICLGLALWAIGQVVWTWEIFREGWTGVASPSWSDIFYILADISWLLALLTILKSLGRRGLTEIGRFTAILTTGLGLLITFILWIDKPHITAGNSPALIQVICDLVYAILTFSNMMLAAALVVGDNDDLPRPVHQCLRYMCAATAINTVANLAFIVTTKLKAPDPLAYFNGNWVDWLFLTAMYCWGASALKYPVREEELHYTFGTTRSGMLEEDIYRAVEIAESYSNGAQENACNGATYLDSTRWILDTIPRCWRVVKLGDLVVGSAFLYPVPRHLMKTFREGKMNERKEREMFEKVKSSPLAWDCLYLADASILANHRRRGLAFECFRMTIENIEDEHNKPQMEVYCWPNTFERKKLAEKLKKHFKEKGIRVIALD